MTTTWKPTLRLALTAQPAIYTQVSLFAPVILDQSHDSPCKHAADGWQDRFDGGLDRICASCGAILETIHEPEQSTGGNDK
jgi:hypothetical protein